MSEDVMARARQALDEAPRKGWDMSNSQVLVRDLLAALERVNEVIESPYWGTYWGEVFVPQSKLREVMGSDVVG